MLKTYLPIIGFALTTTLALPALAQTNPSLEGYEGGHVAGQTAFGTAQGTPSFNANGNQLANNPGLEGYNGNGTINENARFGTLVVERSQYASNDDAKIAAAREARNDFTWIEERVRYSGR